MIAVSATLVVIAIKSTLISLSINAPSLLLQILRYTPNTLVGLAVIMTIVSGILYVGKHREVLKGR
jgi:hypothetical protein